MLGDLVGHCFDVAKVFRLPSQLSLQLVGLDNQQVKFAEIEYSEEVLDDVDQVVELLVEVTFKLVLKVL